MTRDGTAAAPITIKNYPGEAVYLEPPTCRCDNEGFQFNGAAYVRLQGETTLHRPAKEGVGSASASGAEPPAAMRPRRRGRLLQDRARRGYRVADDAGLHEPDHA